MAVAKASSLNLYGQKNMNAIFINTVVGGTITTLGSYTVHTFSSNNIFSTSLTLAVEYMLVGGGGGGGGTVNSTGVPGYGGQTIVGSTTLVPGVYTITVGSGGATAFYDAYPRNGNNSSIVGRLTNLIGLGGRSGSSTSFGSWPSPAGGQDPDWASAYAGGQVTNSFTGVSTTYGVTGTTSALNSTVPGPTGIGGGGGSPWNSNNTAGTAGSDGLVVIKYISI